TFEGPMLSLKNVNAISHFTDWTIAHVHVGALGWNGFLIFGMLYWLVPKMWSTKLYSKKMANIHFWIGTLGILFYVLPMYVSGMFQSLMWKQFNEFGNLAYPNFLEVLSQFKMHYVLRLLGGLLYFTGVILMIWNLMKTAFAGSFIANEDAESLPLEASPHASKNDHWHRWIEGRPIKLAIFALIAILIGGFVEYIPMVIAETNTPTIATVKPYTPLELAGRDIYIREGCTVCHSQMIRPFRSETERYGEYSKAGEFVYDHPFVWGSKRTGPDLMRIGGKYSDDWHYYHMQDPRASSPGSLMPIYPWLFEDDLDLSYVESKITTLRKLGVPYPEGYESEALADLEKQAKKIESNLKAKGINDLDSKKELIAIIAYLQRMGTNIETSKE
ncbi:MAG: cytochrome-c oxidase, cbb3-type subunit II, partial [Polaribacter sp.]